jgi:hypothetical protein
MFYLLRICWNIFKIYIKWYSKLCNSNKSIVMGKLSRDILWVSNIVLGLQALYFCRSILYSNSLWDDWPLLFKSCSHCPGGTTWRRCTSAPPPTHTHTKHLKLVRLVKCFHWWSRTLLSLRGSRLELRDPPPSTTSFSQDKSRTAP